MMVCTAAAAQAGRGDVLAPMGSGAGRERNSRRTPTLLHDGLGGELQDGMALLHGSRCLAERSGRYRRPARARPWTISRAIQGEPRLPSSHPEAAAQSDELGHPSQRLAPAGEPTVWFTEAAMDDAAPFAGAGRQMGAQLFGGKTSAAEFKETALE
jgi:hypothetical protein